jgi:hypothetical protein
MAPLPKPGHHHGCTEEQDQESRDNALLARNVNSLQYLYRTRRQPNTPEIRSRSTHSFSAAEQDNFLFDTLSAAWQLALASQAHFDDDSTNHAAPATTTTTTTTATTVATTTTSGRQYIHSSTDLDHHEDSGDNSADLDHHEDSGDTPSMQ